MTKTPRSRHPLPRRILAIVWDVHTLAGLLTGALLLVIMTAGTLLPFHDMIHTWSEDILRVPSASNGVNELFAPLHAAPDATAFLAVIPEPGAYAEVWTWDAQGEITPAYLDAGTGKTFPSQSHIARDLEWMHYLYHFPFGFQLTALLGIIATLSLISGLLLHSRDIFKRFGRLRTQPPRAAIADVHTLLGTLLAIPLLVMTTTGAIIPSITLSAIVQGTFAFDGDKDALNAAAAIETWPTASNVRVELPNPVDVIAKGEDELHSKPTWLYAVVPHDAQAVWEVGSKVPSGFGYQEVTWRAQDGQVIHKLTPQIEPSIRALQRISWSLHYGDWAGQGIAVLYGIFGLLSTALVAAGIALWRRRVSTGWRARLIDISSITAVGGLLAAAGLVLLANRWMPLGWEGRATFETALLFTTWAATLLLPIRLKAMSAMRTLAAIIALTWGLAALTSIAQMLSHQAAPLPFDAIALVIASLAMAFVKASSPSGGPNAST